MAKYPIEETGHTNAAANVRAYADDWPCCSQNTALPSWGRQRKDRLVDSEGLLYPQSCLQQHYARIGGFFCAPTFWDCNSLIIPHCCKYGHLDMRIWTSESITLLKPSSDQRSTTRRNRFRTLQGKVAELWTQGAQGGWWCCLRLSLSSHQKLVLGHQSVPCGQNDSFGWRKEGITSSVCLEEQPCVFKTWV